MQSFDLPSVLAGAASSMLAYTVARSVMSKPRAPAAYHPPIRSPGLSGFLYRHSMDLRGLGGKDEFAEIFIAWMDKSVELGHKGAVEYEFGHCRRRLAVEHPDDLAHILSPSRDGGELTYVKDIDPYGRIEFLLGTNSLVTIRGEAFHTVQRRAVSPAFSPGALTDIANSAVLDMFKNLTETVNGQLNSTDASSWSRVDLERGYNKTALDIMAISAFNKTDIGTLGTDLEELQNRKFSMFAVCYPKVHGLLPDLTKIKLGLTVKKVKEKSLQFVRDVKAEQEEDDGGKSKEKKKKHKMLVELLAAMPDSTTASLRDHAVTFIFAGHETTGRALTWTSVLLCQHPRVQELLHEELSTAFSLGVIPTLEDLKGCSYLLNVVKESLRYYPPAPVVARTNNKDDVLPYSKIFVPKGTCTMVSPFIVHRSKRVYGPDANEFRPERWDEPLIQNQDESKIFLPFLAGKRNCIGKDFAMAELLIGVATLVRKYQMKWPEGRPLPGRTISATLKPTPSTEFDVRARTK